VLAITGTMTILTWNPSSDTTAGIRTGNYIQGSALKTITANRDRLIIQNAIQQYQQNDGVTELRIQNTAGTNVSFRDFSELVNIRVYSAFANSIRDYRLGWYRQEPWIFLQVPDSHVSRGAMLDWEKQITRDMTNIFGVTLTLNPNPEFTDKTINGKDVRMLLDSNNLPIIQYGFTKNGILISTSEISFINLEANVQAE
jgi:hypothetical protein